MKKVLIIGSKGFIGSHCVDFFAQSCEVWQCDVVVDYVTTNYYMVDATNANFDDIFRIHDFDICINCSGAASVPLSIENPQRDFYLNVLNVVKHVDAIRKYNPDCKYIHLSSAATYGNPDTLPIQENHAIQPISPYGLHKQMAEGVCKEYYDHFGVKTCSLRIFSAYGPGLKKQLFWDLFQKQKKQKTIHLYGTGKESRDFVFIHDILTALHCVIEKGSFVGDSINLASGRETLIEDAVGIFYALSENKNDVVFDGQERKGDPLNWVADISKLTALGYTPKHSLEEGLKQYMVWLQKNV